MVNLTMRTNSASVPKLIVNKLHFPFAGLSAYHVQGPVLDAGRETTVTKETRQTHLTSHQLALREMTAVSR